MNLTNLFKKRKKRSIARRAYAGAKMDRLTNSWTQTNQSINEDIKAGGKVLRSRARDLSLNNDYAIKYLSLMTANVVGAQGITLQSKARTTKGKLDSKANRIIEQQWKAWGKAKNCSFDGQMGWLEIQRIFIESVARDGEVLIRLIRDDSLFGLRLQLLDINRLDETCNFTMKNGNVVNMGIEMDEYSTPIAYHLLTHASSTYAQGGRSFERVPAADIIHAFRRERAEQIRGATWMASVMRSLNMLDSFFEAELVASRISASKMGFYTSEAGDSYVGEEDDMGHLVAEAEPGIFEQLPAGTSFQAFDPQHPTSAFKDFTKGIIRSVAGGLGVSYNSLSSDLEGVSFSSIRSGTLEERDQYRMVQSFMIDHFISRVYDEWLKMVLLKGNVAFSYADYDKLSEVRWQPRGWSWVDPAKDIKASKEAILAGVKTASQVAAEQGQDLEDIYAQIKYEQELAKTYGIDLDIKHEVQTNEKESNQDG